MQTKGERYFYSITSAIMLLLMVIGFKKFYLEGHRPDNSPISPPILGYVLVHGLALSLWIVLFFVQSVLIAAHNRKLHMKLGWATALVGLLVAVSGPLVAVAAPRLHPTEEVFGMTYGQFMLPMLTEIAVFTVFVSLGIWYRKRPAVHRSLMLLATLSVISGATARTDFFVRIFGESGWIALFGPPLVLGALILVVRAVMTRTIDRWYTAGYVAYALVYVAAMNLAVGPSWTQIARHITQG